MVKLTKIDLRKHEPSINPAINLAKKPTFELNKKRRTPPDSDPSFWFPNLKEPSGGLVPVGDTGLYVTPDTPADPQDCDRYPDSPWCGENPFTWKPFNFEVSLALDSCNIGIRFDGVFGFIKIPPASLVYRFPECREIEPPPKKIEDFELPTGPGYYIPYYEGHRRFEVKQILIVEKLEGIYRRPLNSQHLTAWKVSFLGCDNQVHQMHNLDGELDKLIRPAPVRYGWETETVYLGKVLLHSAGISSDTQGNQQIPPFQRLDPKVWGVPCLGPYFPPPSPKEKCCMPQCCAPPDNSLLKALIKKVNELDKKIGQFPQSLDLEGKQDPIEVKSIAESIKLTTKRLELINKTIGVDEYPASVPASIISKDEGFLGNLIPNSDKEIKNLTQFHAWFFERFDEVMGQFEVPIEIKDSDPATPGEQPIGIKIPNVAEYVGESMGMQLQANINLELLVNICTRLLIEAGQDKQQNFKNYMMSEAIAEYLGFEQKQVVKKMPLSFKPGEEDFSSMLQETEVDVSVPDCVEKTTLQKTAARILEFTSRAQAAVWRSLDPKGDMKGQIVSLIKGFASTKDTVQQKEQDDDDFKRFTEDAEIGFINTPGITDVEHPYGGSYEERPRIREIGNSSPSSSAQQP